MAECENCVHQYVCEKRTCAECVGSYCDECEIYCEYDGKPDIENCEDFINANDVVPVVRCKDCKHYKAQEKSAHWENKIKYCCRVATLKVNDNDFCSYGERKADNE